MTNQNRDSSLPNSRRNFLKKASAIGSILPATFLSTQLMANNYTKDKSNRLDHSQACKTSELADDFIYLNSGTEGSMPNCVIDSFNQNLKRWASNPTASYETDQFFGKHQHYQREKIAKLFSVEKNNITLTDNTTMGMYMVLMGLNFKSTDTIIYTNQEHTAITSPLAVHKEKTGVKLELRNFPTANKLSKISAEELIEFLFPNIEELRGATALCVSHVYPSTGIRLPLKLLRKKADQLGVKYLIVDGAQAFGMIDVSKGNDDIKHCDFYACPGHKWLNGPPSTGILYLKNADIKPPEFYPTLSQRMEKYSTLDGSLTRYFSMAEALQVRGCSNAPGYTAMLKALEFQNDLGGSQIIEKHIVNLSQKVKAFIYDHAPLSLVSPINDPSLASGLTVFFPFSWKTPKTIFTDKVTTNRVVQALLQKNIQIRSIGFNDSNKPDCKIYALRVSTAIFNDSHQIDLFQTILKDVLNSLH